MNAHDSFDAGAHVGTYDLYDDIKFHFQFLFKVKVKVLRVTTLCDMMCHGNT